jgi:hypothetical protein
MKIITDQDGLYGYGCASFTLRSDLIGSAVESISSLFLSGARSIVSRIFGSGAIIAPIGAADRFLMLQSGASIGRYGT